MMTFDSEPPAMFGPDVWALDDKAEAYDELRRRANDMGFLTVGEALDALDLLRSKPISFYSQSGGQIFQVSAKDWFWAHTEAAEQARGAADVRNDGTWQGEMLVRLDKPAE